MASKAVYINEAGIRRRWNPRDVHHHSSGGNDLRGPAPNVHNSLAIQKKHVASMYRSWRSLNSHAHGPLDTDLYVRHIPVGRVCAQRTSRAPLTETDLGNMYAGSYVFAPGPCAYDANKDSWCAQPGPKLGHAPRKCMTAGENHPQLAHAKRFVGESPGPGAYAMGDSSVMANRGGTFAAADERNGAASALEMAVGRLRTLEWRIGFIRRGLREPEGLRLGQALVVKTQSGRELERIESIASRLRVEVERLAERAAAVAAKRDPLPGPSLGGSSGLGRVPDGDWRPASTAEGGCASRKRLARGQGADRFYDPLASTASFLDSPGPGTYDLRRDENALGRASLWRSPSFDLTQRRVVGEQATTGRSLVSLKLHRTCGRGGGSGGGGGGGGVGVGGGVGGVGGGGGDGSGGDDGGGGGGGSGGNVDEKTHIMAPFHAYVSGAGPGQYTPDMCAPPLTSQTRRRRVAANP